jgi:hypothetical protein
MSAMVLITSARTNNLIVNSTLRKTRNAYTMV